MANPGGTPKNLRPWKPGQSGNPAGRAANRVALETDFVEALRQDFRAHGASAIERCRKRHVPAYLAVIARLIPREISVEVARREAVDVEAVQDIISRFARLKQERDAALERVQRIEGSVAVQPVESCDTGKSPR